MYTQTLLILLLLLFLFYVVTRQYLKRNNLVNEKSLNSNLSFNENSIAKTNITYDQSIGRKEIHSLLIPLKFKVRRNLSGLSSIIREYYEDPVVELNNYNEIKKKLTQNNISIPEKVRLRSKFNRFLLDCLKKEKIALLKEKYTERALIQDGWIALKNTVENPVYSFQDIYFDYINKEKVIGLFGEELSTAVEEILRDDFITENEREYLLEKAEENNIDSEIMNKLLSTYFDSNPALRKLLYQICKDGVVTDAEKNYLLEKAAQYKISNRKIISEIESITSTIKKIRKLFQNNIFYGSVILLMLSKFIDPMNKSLHKTIMSRLHNWIESSKPEILFKEFKMIRVRLTTRLNEFSKFNLLDVENASLNELLKILGVNTADHSEVVSKLKKEPIELYSVKEMTKFFEAPKHNKQQISIGNSKYKFGGTEFEFNFVDGPNYPLFGYDTIGESVIITINKAHYFYDETETFRLWVISLVINLKKNYAIRFSKKLQQA